jgi:DMSO reductase anchor subunit
MNPAFSVIFLTTLSGMAQGLVVTMALATLAAVPMAPYFPLVALALAVLLLLAALGASFLHLGRPLRAWRAVLMWRTSWLSREVIVLPAFIASIALWWWLLRAGVDTAWMPVLVIALALALWYCTAMIYACLTFIQEWATPLTLVTFSFTGLASGLLLACALAAWMDEAALLAAVAPSALVATLFAGFVRWQALARNRTLKPKSTLQSATGIRSPALRQVSMGMSAGSFNTREFFHRMSQRAVANIKAVAMIAGYALPALCALWALQGGGALPWALAVAIQAPGLVADRWLFFAQARHPQNLYYQVVS